MWGEMKSCQRARSEGVTMGGDIEHHLRLRAAVGVLVIISTSNSRNKITSANQFLNTALLFFEDPILID